MNNTSDSYQAVLEREINRWSGFHIALRKDDREAFEELLEMFRNNAHASEAANSPFPFEPMVMSILLAQQKKLQELEHELSQCKESKLIC